MLNPNTQTNQSIMKLVSARVGRVVEPQHTCTAQIRAISPKCDTQMYAHAQLGITYWFQHTDIARFVIT